MKLYKNIALSLLLSFSMAAPAMVHAQDEIVVDRLTIGQIRMMAREHTADKKPYQEAIDKIAQEKDKNYDPYFDAKNYSYDYLGRETVTYISGGKPYDYDEKIESYEDRLENLQDENEKTAISKFEEIVNKSYEIKDKERAIELAEKDVKIAELSLKVGTIYPLQLENAKTQLSILKSELDILKSDIEKLFEDLNEIIGYESDARYDLSLEGIMIKVNVGLDSIYVPEDAVSFVIENSKDIENLKENLEEIEDTLGRLETFFPEGTYQYDKRAEELGLEELLWDIDEAKRIEKLNLKKEYTGIYIALIDLDRNYSDLLHEQEGLAIEKVKFDTGIISKVDFEKASASFEELEKSHMNKIISVYRLILDYEMKQ
ncbi:hypothetical protein J2Z35_000938 [Acetoanaerobium pronyense]|uniref:Outer membrane efflux protein n=1 Tax=Acetoanaerobium pronyense TaxID=1482736 RepID=A0ABS4KH89_9FIRM|nr:TolC family protein [Acetoanaerobium pronyense]MBP2027144.1 hypothetical protein [Acetoanaerobium pronyense]